MGSEDKINILDGINIRDLTNEDFIKLAYLTLLQRKADDVGLSYWRAKIADGTFNYKNLIDTIYNSPEFIMHYKVPFNDMLHKGRQAWCGSLESYEVIFDIGGSSPSIEMGALIELGYKHRPKELMIFDLPPGKQYWGMPKFPQDKDYIFSWGVVKYIHGYVEDIFSFRELNDKKFDCVFMGQAIEHIYRDKLDIVLKWIKEHLKENGRFIFDTPNRNITKIQSPEKFIDEDHKYEYSPTEMEEILNKNGFIVVKKTGILNMSGTFSSKNFNPLEAYESELVSDKTETSYVFAFECIKNNHQA